MFFLYLEYDYDYDLFVFGFVSRNGVCVMFEFQWSCCDFGYLKQVGFVGFDSIE